MGDVPRIHPATHGRTPSAWWPADRVFGRTDGSAAAAPSTRRLPRLSHGIPAPGVAGPSRRRAQRGRGAMKVREILDAKGRAW